MSEATLAEALSSFTAAPAELVAREPLVRRRDSKFVLSAKELAEVLGPLVSHYRAEPTIPTYRTLYFDTPDLRCFHDQRRGVRPRYKLRLRHELELRQTFFEIKTKRSKFLAATLREPRPFETSELSPADLELVAATCNQPPAQLEPQLWVKLRRRTLVGAETEERIMIDTAIELERDGVTESLGQVVMVQVEQRPYRYKTPIRAALRHAGHRRVSAGKYGLATVLFRPELGIKRLARALRLINGAR